MPRPCPVPYASSLATLRAFLHAACKEGLSIEKAALSLGLKGRFRAYYAQAAEALGLARRKDGKLVICPLGQDLLRTRTSSYEEACAFRRAIEGSTVHEVVPDLLTKEGPKGGVVAALLRAGLTKDMARQRGEALERWRKHIFAADQGELPFAAASAMEYQGRAMLRRLEGHGFKAFGEGNRGGSVVLDVAPLTLLAGPNGAGKSTLLRTLSRTQPALGGAILLDGAALDSLSARDLARRLSVVLTEHVTPGLLTAQELVALGRHPHTDWSGRLSEEDYALVAWALEATGSRALGDRQVTGIDVQASSNL